MQLIDDTMAGLTLAAPQGYSNLTVYPRISFGQPVLDGFGVRSAILAERFHAGDSIGALAHDYGLPPEAIENALRCEPRAA